MATRKELDKLVYYIALKPSAKAKPVLVGTSPKSRGSQLKAQAAADLADGTYREVRVSTNRTVLYHKIARTGPTLEERIAARREAARELTAIERAEEARAEAERAADAALRELELAEAAREEKESALEAAEAAATAAAEAAAEAAETADAAKQTGSDEGSDEAPAEPAPASDPAPEEDPAAAADE